MYTRLGRKHVTAEKRKINNRDIEVIPFFQDKTKFHLKYRIFAKIIAENCSVIVFLKEIFVFL